MARGKIVNVALRLIDEMTAPMRKATDSFIEHSKQMENAGKKISKAGKSISDAGSKLTTGVTVPIAAAGVACFELASDMNESMNKVDVAFGKSAKNVKNWSETTLKSYGIAQGTALDMASGYGDMATSMGLSQKQAAKMSKNLVGLAGDLSSFKNISSDVANTALNGIFTGETESLKQLGVVMTETNLEAYAMQSGFLKGKADAGKLAAATTKVEIAQERLATKIKKYGANSLEAKTAQASLTTALEKQSKISKGSLDDLTEAEKVQLRYNYVLAKTKNAQGDFARTSSGAANQQRIFTEGLKELGANIGTKLIPVGTKLITWANSLISKFSSLSDEQQNMILKFAGIAAAVGPGLMVFGKLTSGVGGVITSFGTLGGTIAKSAKAFDKIKDVGKIGGAFSKFGKLGKAAFMMFTNPAFIAVAAIAAIIVIAVLLIKNWTKVKNFFGKVGQTIKKVFKSSGGDAEKFGTTFTKVKNTVTRLIKAMGKVIGGIIDFMTPIVKFLGNVFAKGFKVYLAAVGGYFSGLTSGIMDTISGVTKVLNGLIDFISGVFSGNWSKAWEGVKEIFGGVFDTFAGLAKTPINSVIGLINGAISGINGLGLKIPDWVPGLGGKDFSINIPKIPMLATGGLIQRAGTALVGERGPELVHLPRGAQVVDHSTTKEMMSGKKNNGSCGNITIAKIADSIIIREEADIDKFATKFAEKLDAIINNTGGEPAYV